MTPAEIMSTLTGYLVNELGLSNERGEGFDSTTPLLEWGLLDSFAMVRLVSFIEQQFHFEVGPEDLAAKNFRTLQTMTDFVVARTSKR